jgi:hypothetical protein
VHPGGAAMTAGNELRDRIEAQRHAEVVEAVSAPGHRR